MSSFDDARTPAAALEAADRERNVAEVFEALPKLRHDLRTPLNQIIGYTELLQEDASAEMQPDLEKVRSAALALVEGVDHAFEAVRAPLSSRAERERHVAEVLAAIPQLRHDLRTPLNQIIGYTEMLQEDASPEMQPDLANVRSAALNLVEAVDHAFATVRTFLTAKDAVSRLPHLPDPPHLAHPASDAHPAAPGTIDADARAAHVVSAAAAGASLLVVDDNEMNRTMLARRLVRRGFLVETAATGERALELINERSFDLVLLDVMMPGISGMDVLRIVRQTKAMSELPIIMATARNDSSDIVAALVCGANDYVTKPIDLAILLARANTQLALKDANARVRKLVSELETRNAFIRSTFGRYITDEVVENLLETPEGLALGGASRTVTVLMSDLRGFSSLCEGLHPCSVISLLNHYLGSMTSIIMKYGGTIDEFIGDAILVIFGAPTPHEDHAARAIACALEMQRAMPAVNDHSRSIDLPDVEMGIGINTGEVVVGNIGSDRRAKYGVVGRHVNLASRIEALTVGGQVLVSQATLEAAGKDAVRVDGNMEFSPKGSRIPMQVYEVGGIKGGGFDVALPKGGATMVELESPVAFDIAIVEGVHVASSISTGQMSALSRHQAVIRTTADVALRSTVRLRFAGSDGEPVQGDAYAKVIKSDASGGFVLHFTVMPADVEEYLAVQTAGPRSRP